MLILRKGGENTLPLAPQQVDQCEKAKAHFTITMCHRCDGKRPRSYNSDREGHQYSVFVWPPNHNTEQKECRCKLTTKITTFFRCTNHNHGSNSANESRRGVSHRRMLLGWRSRVVLNRGRDLFCCKKICVTEVCSFFSARVYVHFFSQTSQHNSTDKLNTRTSFAK